MNSCSDRRLTQEEAYALILGLTDNEKFTLYEMLLGLRRNLAPAEPPRETDLQED